MRLLGGKKGGHAGAEQSTRLRRYADEEGDDAAFPASDSPTYAYNPFADDFGPTLAHAPTSSQQVVEDILRDHARGPPPSSDAEQGRQLQEVPLHDWTGAGSRAPSASLGESEEQGFQSRLPLGNPFYAAAEVPPVNPFLAAEPFAGRAAAGAAEEAGEPSKAQPDDSVWARRGSAAEPYALATPPAQLAAGSRRGLAPLDTSEAWEDRGELSKHG
jgi:hypothetical protein